MFLPGLTPTNTNLPTTTATTTTTMNNNNLHQQQFLFDNLKDHCSNKLSSSMSRKTSPASNFSLDPELLRELNARYLNDINITRFGGGANSTMDGNALPPFLSPPFLRAEHYHQHTHTHEHNLNILTPPNNSLLNGNLNNSILDKLSKSSKSLSPLLRSATAVNNFSPGTFIPPPPPLFPSISLTNNSTTSITSANNNNNNNNNNSTKETVSPPAKKSSKWCAAHVRISWMIYQQQQRSKEKLSPSDNRKDEEPFHHHHHHHHHQQQQSQSSSSNSKLPDLISNTKSALPSTLPASTSDLSLSLPSAYPSPHLPLPSFNYRSPFDFTGVNNGTSGRLPPSSNTAFGGLGSLFPSVPPPPLPTSLSTGDRRSNVNGSVAAAAALGLDWSRFYRGLGPSSLIASLTPLSSSSNDSLSLKKFDDTNNSNHENKRRSLSVLNNDDDRRNSHHHLMLPPSHLTNSSSNRSRSRSPHPSLHHHHHHHHASSSSSLLNKNSSSSPPSPSHLTSSSRKHNSPNIKSSTSDTSKNSSHPSAPPPPPLPTGLPSVPHPPTFGSLDPLTLSIIERQRLSAAYTSLYGSISQPNNFFPGNIDPTAIRNNSPSNLFPIVDSSTMAAALMQREHFLNTLRQQQEQIIGRDRAAVTSAAKSSKSSTINMLKTEQKSPKMNAEEISRISPKPRTSPGSHSSTSSSSESSKKIKHSKHEQEASSLPIPTNSGNTEVILKEKSNVELASAVSNTI